METKYGFALYSIDEFETWIASLKVARTVVYLQQHHTYSPDYALFKGNNHFELQRSMKTHHVKNNGWADIGQHFTIFPDGSVMTGRKLENAPACIFGNNAHAICIENLGNFDKGKDTMLAIQSESIVRASAAICKRFNIPVNTERIVYHHWFRLDNGVRNNGAGGNKSCPGTAFFGGNKVANCQTNFLPLVAQAIANSNTLAPNDSATVLKYVSVTASSLNIRTQANAASPKVDDRSPAKHGTVLRVYKEQNGWYKISSTKSHWVVGTYTQVVARAVVTANQLNIRNAPNAQALKIGSYVKGQEVFVYQESNGWSKTDMYGQWVSSDFLKKED